MCDKQDPLELLPLKRSSELQSAFKSDWPRGYAALEIQKQWAKHGIEYNFKVYCPFGDVMNGMVAVNSRDTFYQIIIQCPRDNTEKLTEALKKTKVIDWNFEVVVPYAPRNVIECLRNTAQDISVELTVQRYFNTYILEEDIYGDVDLPPNITFGSVTLKHLDLVNETFPNRCFTSARYFQRMIDTKSGYGLYLNDELISWVFIKEAGTLHHLYTVQEHRRKGYTEILMKLASKIWLKEGKPVFAICLQDNISACEVYEKLGFALGEPVASCLLNKKNLI